VGKKGSPELFLADATLYLEFFGIIGVAWQWLVQATAIVKALRNRPCGVEANFYYGKFYAFRYFFEYELPKIEGLANRLMNSDGLTVEIKPEFFSDWQVMANIPFGTMEPCEIRRSMIDLSLGGLPSRVTHSSSAKATVCAGG